MSPEHGKHDQTIEKYNAATNLDPVQSIAQSSIIAQNQQRHNSPAKSVSHEAYAFRRCVICSINPVTHKAEVHGLTCASARCLVRRSKRRIAEAGPKSHEHNDAVNVEGHASHFTHQGVDVCSSNHKVAKSPAFAKKTIAA
jgi:hypothetical protein